MIPGLPLAGPSLRRRRASEPFHCRTMNERLLLIDDDARLSTMVGDYLRGHGFELDCAGSLAAGRERLKRRAATTCCCST